jgi:hypothetical protein
MPDKDGRNQRPIIGVEREKSQLQALRQSKIVQTNANHWIVIHECRLSLGSGKSWVELRPATESTMSLHISTNPTTTLIRTGSHDVGLAHCPCHVPRNSVCRPHATASVSCRAGCMCRIMLDASNREDRSRGGGPSCHQSRLCREGMIMAKCSYERGYPKHIALLALLFLSVGTIALVSDVALAQQQQLSQVRPAATPERTNTTTAALPSPAIDNTSALAQALGACNQNAEKETFTLPGLKGEVTLDRCYKGRAHLICVFTALSTEAQSLTDTYTKIVDVKYPDLNTVDGVCQVSAQTLAADITGSEVFAKRFKELKSQYEATTKCAGNVEQAFKEASFADMTQAPEVLKSMIASIDGDIAKTSKVYEQVSDLSAKIEVANKAMKTVTKLHHAMCMNEKAVEQSGREHGVERR